jgi:hypothetical protein
MRREVFFCDLDKDALTQLGERLAGHWMERSETWASSHLLWGDNEGALQQFAQRIRVAERARYAIGSIIIDPNGYWYRNDKGHGPPVDGLARFAAEFRRIDIILNLNTQAYKRQRAVGHDLLPPVDVLKSLDKEFWLVKLTKAAGSQFLLAVGRNVQTGDHRKLGFFKLESVEGQEIMAAADGRCPRGFFDDQPVRDLP